VPHGFPEKNPEFSFNLPGKGMRDSVVLKEPETFKILCDVHPWELAWCHVVEHSFFAVTDPQGWFRIDTLPQGEYEVEFWHEHGRLGTQQKRVVTAGGRATRMDDVSFGFRKHGRPRRRPG
jgi:hypothetical protein